MSSEEPRGIEKAVMDEANRRRAERIASSTTQAFALVPYSPKVRQRVRLRAHPGSRHGIVEALHLSAATPSVDVYWGTLDRARTITREKVVDLELVTEHVAQPDEVIARHAREAARAGAKVTFLAEGPA